ncbi:hypothetical protein [Candidatus Neptunichlamydia sp. REUL1]|uniref:hypothetical protein n=1 Tax=Candidatus Neptunichlamydia sp. REUL1 TaxID=3064277 RepID=UPI00292CDB15|nr:hypothetical protein [Candidatus Neptunochlamydia sp. REUL1]
MSAINGRNSDPIPHISPSERDAKPSFSIEGDTPFKQAIQNSSHYLEQKAPHAIGFLMQALSGQTVYIVPTDINNPASKFASDNEQLKVFLIRANMMIIN